MKKSTRSLISYALSISMLFNTATLNQANKVGHAILPEKFKLEEPKEEKDMKLKKALNK